MNKYLLCTLLIAALFSLGCSTVPQNHVQIKPAVDDQITPEEKWGIKVVGVRPTGAGYMLNFRYKIIDPEKAAALVDPQIKPYLVDQTSGKKVSVPNLPKVGSLRQRSREAKSDRIYFILFSNPRKFIQSGDKVTVVIGNFRTADLIVE